MAIKKMRPESARSAAVPAIQNFKLVPLSRVDKAPWNYKENEEDKAKALTGAIKRSGQIVNINIRQKDDGRYEVLDGNHRLDALMALGYSKALAYDHGAISEREAQRLAIELNEARFGTDERKFKELLSGLQDAFTIADLNLTIPPGLLLTETHYREDFDYQDLGDPEITGEDTRRGRFILVYQTEAEKELLAEFLGVDGDKVVYDIDDFPVLSEIAQVDPDEE